MLPVATSFAWFFVVGSFLGFLGGLFLEVKKKPTPESKISELGESVRVSHAWNYRIVWVGKDL